MKKRILSIALCAVLVVAMVASMLVSVSAYTYYNEPSFDVAKTTQAPLLDAQMDDVYWNSEMISNAYTYYGSGVGVGFDSWTVVTDDGIYVYAKIKDATVGSEYMIYNDNRGANNSVSNADKFQYYFQFTFSDSTSWWGYFELDYYANNVDGETMVDNDITSAWGKNYFHTCYVENDGSYRRVNDNALPTGIDYATKILRDSTGAEYGWTAEFFVPFNAADNLPETATGVPAIAVGVQANNDDWHIDEGKTAFKDGWMYRQGYAYSNYTDCSYYNGPTSSKFIPLTIKDTSAYDYRFYTTSEHIEMDGKIDDAYLNSTMIKKQSTWKSSATDNDWWMYPVATLDGVYFVGHVDDPTMNNVKNTDPANGEMFQIYLDWSAPDFAHTNPRVTFDKSATRGYNGVTGTWMGWFQFDYEGYLTGAFDTDNTWLSDADLVINKITNPIWNGIDGSKNQYTGYDFELFIPYTNYMKNVVAIQSSEYHFSLGVQVNDDCTYDGKEDRNSITFDNTNLNTGLGYYAHFENLPEVQLVYADDLAPHATGDVVTTSLKDTLDGANTNGEYDSAEIIPIATGGKGNHSLGQYRVICDGTYVQALFEIVDDTPSYSSAMLGKYRDYIDVYSSRWGAYHQSWSGGYVGIGRDTNNDYIKTVDNKENGWVCEYRWTLTAEEKSLYAQGKFQIGISVQALDGYGKLGIDNGDERYYKYDSVTDCGAFWTNSNGLVYSQIFRRFTFAAKDVALPTIDGANVALGDSITLNYYATLGAEDTDAKLKVTMNDKVTYLGAQATDTPNQYKFAFKGIAPQTMGDNVSAELIVDGKVVDTKATYSVLDNVTKLVADDEDLFENTELEQLVYELLNYGAAAQVYAGYKTDALVNAGYEDGSVAEWEDVAENNDRTFTGALADGRFTAAGVYHANTNKIYAKFDVEDAENATVKVNGKPVMFDKYEHDGRVYIAYSEDIKVIDFDKVYTFELTTAEGTQTLTYSVNAYAYAKCEAEDTATAGLAKALYFYGIAAKDYAAN